MSQVRPGRCGAGPERHQHAIIAGNAVTTNLDPSWIYNCFYMTGRGAQKQPHEPPPQTSALSFSAQHIEHSKLGHAQPLQY
jgi:hypothetical protein